MTRKTLRNTILATGAILVVAGGFVLMAHAGPSGGVFGGHGGRAAHFHHAMAHLVDDLELDADQQARVGTVHETLMARHQSLLDEHLQHVAGLAERIENGTLDPLEARAMVDRHVEDIRLTAYTVVDEVVALVNSLDDDQRAVLLEHLEQAKTHGEHLRADAD